jgi:hypothetical protein
MGLNKYLEIIKEHYNQYWGNAPSVCYMNGGPLHQLPAGYHVLRYAPSTTNNAWVYATCGMSMPTNKSQIELHIYAPEKNDDLVEILSALCHYHNTGSSLGLNHTVNFGQPWWPGSNCCYGLISAPYIEDPSFGAHLSNEIQTQFLWLIPITEREILYKKQNGIQSLEDKFEQTALNYIDPYRSSVV